jgi:hypothetical protein
MHLCAATPMHFLSAVDTRAQYKKQLSRGERNAGRKGYDAERERIKREEGRAPKNVVLSFRSRYELTQDLGRVPRKPANIRSVLASLEYLSQLRVVFYNTWYCAGAKAGAVRTSLR